MRNDADMRTATKPHLWRRMLPALLSASFILPAGLALNFALNVLLARLLPVADYGLFAYAQSLASILAVAGSLGFSTSMMRFVAAYRVQDQQALLLGLMRYSLRLILLSSILLALILLILGQIFPKQNIAFAWSAALLVPLTIDIWRESAMRGLHRTSAAILPRQVVLPGLTLLVVAALDITHGATALTAFLTLLILVESAALRQLWCRLAWTKGSHALIGRREWLRASLPMAGANLARQSITRLDVVLVAALLGLEAAGPYAAAARTALLAGIVLRVVNLVVGPMLAELYHSGDFHRFRRLLMAAALSTAAAGLPIYLLVLLSPVWVLGLFGAEYADAALPLQILATGQFINLATGPASLALTMSRHEQINLWLTACSAAAGLLGFIMLVPLYGTTGAAIAAAGAVGLTNLTQVGACAWVFRERALTPKEANQLEP